MGDIPFQSYDPVFAGRSCSNKLADFQQKKPLPAAKRRGAMLGSRSSNPAWRSCLFSSSA